MILRHANIHDLSLLRHWDEQPHVIAADPNDDWNWEEEELSQQPEWCEHLIAEMDGTPIGFIEIIDPAREESHYWGDVSENLRAIDIWIGEEVYLGKGYGTQMMQLAIERCFKDKEVIGIIIDPLATNEGARRFYERLGFTFLDYRQFNKDYCAVYRLDREQWKSGK
jgi:aminoglycoside 6'-N-acetyltransferase